MQVEERIFFTARFAKDAKFAKRKYIFFSVDPPERRQAGRAEKNLTA